MTELVDPRHRFTLQAERDFRTSVRPVYRNSAAQPGKAGGSSLTIQTDGHQLKNKRAKESALPS